MESNTLKVYKVHPGVALPIFGTEQAACFDLAYQPHGKHVYEGYSPYNSRFERPLANGNIVIMPGERVLVPTGLIFDIPEGYSVRIHSRSGLSYKLGLVLANQEAVIDSDYVHETFLMVANMSSNQQTIRPGDRIAQGELVRSLSYSIEETTTQPTQKTDRVGGLGSTGVVTLPPGTKFVALSETQPVKRGRGRPRKVQAA